MAKEKALLNKTMVLLSKWCRLFRNNVGTGWVGNVVETTQTENNGLRVVIVNARRFKAGLTKGSSDLIGWTTVTITPEMVGKKMAIFTALEGKTGRTATSKEQKNFIKQVNINGGIAGTFHTKEEAEHLIKLYHG